MKETDFLTICARKTGCVKLALSSTGDLWTKKEESNQNTQSWDPINFNEMYQGYYTPCTFTAIVSTDMNFVAAGMGIDGLPYVYQSILGNVWEPLNLLGGTAFSGYQRVTGRVNQILYENKNRQLLLLCSNGELVILPDCPKCLRIQKISNQGIVEGLIEDSRLTLRLEDQGLIELPMDEITLLRISVSYAKNILKKEGYLIDFRTQEKGRDESELCEKARVHHITTDELEEFLETISKDTLLVFLCHYGKQADEASFYARTHGYTRAYSLGGAKDMFHVE